MKPITKDEIKAKAWKYAMEKHLGFQYCHPSIVEVSDSYTAFIEACDWLLSQQEEHSAGEKGFACRFNESEICYTQKECKITCQNYDDIIESPPATTDEASAGETDRKIKRITLCGSTRFKKEFEAVNRQLSLEGHIVYSVAFFGHADKVPLTTEQKELLDRVHKQKILNSDGIFVIDVDGYIGESTRSEIEYAEHIGKFVKYLSSFPDLKYISDVASIPQPPATTEEASAGIVAILNKFKEFCRKEGYSNVNIYDYAIQQYAKSKAAKDSQIKDIECQHEWVRPQPNSVYEYCTKCNANRIPIFSPPSESEQANGSMKLNPFDSKPSAAPELKGQQVYMVPPFQSEQAKEGELKEIDPPCKHEFEFIGTIGEERCRLCGKWADDLFPEKKLTPSERTEGEDAEKKAIERMAKKLWAHSVYPYSGERREEIAKELYNIAMQEYANRREGIRLPDEVWLEEIITKQQELYYPYRLKSTERWNLGADMRKMFRKVIDEIKRLNSING